MHLCVYIHFLFLQPNQSFLSLLSSQFLLLTSSPHLLLCLCFSSYTGGHPMDISQHGISSCNETWPILFFYVQMRNVVGGMGCKSKQQSETGSALTVRNFTRKPRFSIVTYMQRAKVNPTQAPWLLDQSPWAPMSSSQLVLCGFLVIPLTLLTLIIFSPPLEQIL